MASRTAVPEQGGVQEDSSRQSTRDSGDPLIVVPARVSSRRFVGKALARLAGEPVVAHVVRRALEAEVGPVVVVTDAPAIAAAVAHLCPVQLDTRPARTGSDRVARYVGAFDPAPPWIINLQGDEPCIAPEAIRLVAHTLMRHAGPADMVSAAIPMHAAVGFEDPDVVKVSLSASGHALDFSRQALGTSTRWHLHVGVYGFSPEALAAFHALPTGAREEAEKLEQLRALQQGWSIAMIELAPWTNRPWPSVNRPADLAAAATYLRTAGGTAAHTPEQAQEHG